VIYSKLLYSEKYNLTGKPDYIYKKGNVYFPVELKSGTIKNESLPHQGDFLQLIAYFLILEDLYGAKIKKGKLIYSDYSFIIKNNKRNKKILLKTLKEMRNMLQTGKGKPVCNFAHCKYCVCKQTVCEYYKK
ncbi:MAG: CRISPR-associated protein Cas4, partial [Eubacteriales bacterium]|nr:CRISPR-associated protein Cas4 [Eubacteriales bacterium]